MLTIEFFNTISAGEMIASGRMVDGPLGLNMAGTGKELLWVAIKGYVDDWCIYTHFSEKGIAFVKSNGDKVVSKNNIQRCIQCDDEVLTKYRY